MPMSLHRREFLIAAAGGAWATLIESNSLKGWHAEGKADWRVENGTIIGRQGPGGAAGDLFTDKTWSDFELECEWRMHYPGNSGIWFRYVNEKEAYQADILDQPSHPGVLAGSIYCPGKMFITENHDAATVHKDAWNKMMVRAEKDDLTVVLNGKQVSKIKDNSFHGPGSIGIQVHAGKDYDGMEIRVRGLRVRSI